jgi:DNA mismatch endonuclease (patch repair protein)
VLPQHRKVVLVNGCFWHVHTCRAGKVQPKVNSLYWKTKRRRNIARDKQNLTALQMLGWGVLVIWECELADLRIVERTLKRFLRGHSHR